MHAVLLTLFLLPGANQEIAAVEQQPYLADEAGGCATCGAAEGRCRHGCAIGGVVKGAVSWGWDWFGPMPQTCYQPRFGCYPGNSRDIHRYPAFHGYYYREPYNYRHYFDYPWHAQPHEPLGYFSYQRNNGVPGPDGQVPVEAPVPPAIENQPAPAPPPAPKPAANTQSRWQPAKQRTSRN